MTALIKEKTSGISLIELLLVGHKNGLTDLGEVKQEEWRHF